MEFGQIHHLEYFVDDLKTSNEFWGWFLPGLGYREYQKWDSGTSWAHQNGTYIVFVQIEAGDVGMKNNRHASGLNHIAFKGKSSTHLDELHEQLMKKNIQILTRDENHLCFEDPNHFAVEIFL